MFNLSNPKNLAFISAGIISGFGIGFYVVFAFIAKHFSWTILLGLAFGLFALSFILLSYILERFIYDRIKLIYKTIHRFKANAGQKGERWMDFNKDVIDDVSSEVEDWFVNQNEEMENLRELAQYRRDFVGNVSHELKTPIFNIQGYILTLLDGGLEDPNINKKYLEKTEKSVERMITIVQDLEEISRLESGELKLHQKKFDLREMAFEITDELEAKAKSENVNLYFAENYERPIYVMADPDRINQVLTNLIVNGIKYRSANRDSSVKVSFFDMYDHILCEVTDNGIGVDEKDIPRLFERFYRTDTARSRQHGGSGLGLAIVKHIIEAHNQTINVRSSKDVGTTFAFTIKKA